MNRRKDGRFMKGHKLGGRPEKFDDRDLEKFAHSLFNWVEKERKKRPARHNLSLLSDWCFENNFPSRRFTHYASKHDLFKEAYLWAKAWQEHQIAKGALINILDANFSKFFLGVNHDWITDKGKEDREERQKSSLERLSDRICELAEDHE